jgi:uncharacterized protein (DUF1778 family)
MATNAEHKDYSISMHLPEADIVLMENRLLCMGLEGFAEFTAALSAPAAPVPEMVALTKCPAPWEPGYVARR